MINLKELEPTKEPRAVVEQLGSMHPAPDQLIPAFHATFDGWIADKTRLNQGKGCGS